MPRSTRAASITSSTARKPCFARCWKATCAFSAPWSSIPLSPRVHEPVERIFAILAGYRERILGTDCQYGCPLGRLALEIDPENAPAHDLIAQNFQGWIEAVRECIEEMKPSLPSGTDLDALATYVLVVMEGGVMLSRSYRSVEPFDRAVAQLREHFRLLLGSGRGVC